MASENRRLKKLIKGEIRKVRTGEAPAPPAPVKKSVDPDEFRNEVEAQLQAVRAKLELLVNDGSRTGTIRRNKLDLEKERLKDLLKQFS